MTPPINRPSLLAAVVLSMMLCMSVRVGAEPVIFVHGIGGDASTWGNLPTLIQNDLGVTYVNWTYSTSLTQATPTIESIATYLGDYIMTNYPAGQVDVVCHSMGGLVVRALLCNMVDTPVTGWANSKIRKFLMLGTPNHGSSFASVTAWNYQKQEMMPGSPFLTSLNNTWSTTGIGRSKASTNDILVVAGACTILDALQNGDGIVAVSSASLREFGVPLRLVPYRHASTVPLGNGLANDSRDDAMANVGAGSDNGAGSNSNYSYETYRIAKNFLQGTILTQAQITNSPYWTSAWTPKQTLLDQYVSDGATDVTPPSAPTTLSSSSTSGSTITISWSGASDANGIGKYAVLWNQTASSAPSLNRTVSSASDVFTATAPGNWYAHVRTIDYGGNISSSTAHFGPFNIPSVSGGTWFISSGILNSNNANTYVGADGIGGNGWRFSGTYGEPGVGVTMSVAEERIDPTNPQSVTWPGITVERHVMSGFIEGLSPWYVYYTVGQDNAGNVYFLEIWDDDGHDYWTAAQALSGNLMGIPANPVAGTTYTFSRGSGAIMSRRIASTTKTVTLPSGFSFSNCLVINDTGSTWSTYMDTEYWAPGAGLVKYEWIDPPYGETGVYYRENPPAPMMNVTGVTITGVRPAGKMAGMTAEIYSDPSYSVLVESITTDANGQLDVTLAPGTYYVKYRGDGVLAKKAGTFVAGTDAALPAPSLSVGDINGDNIINVSDYLQVAGQWLATGGSDLNKDGIVNISDYLLISGNWLATGE